MPESRMLEHSTIVLLLGHNQSQCEGRPCTVHSMSNHNMRSFPQHWRSDIGIMERTCPHGVGHPDPDNPWPISDTRWFHGCCGCCTEEDLGDA